MLRTLIEMVHLSTIFTICGPGEARIIGVIGHPLLILLGRRIAVYYSRIYDCLYPAWKIIYSCCVDEGIYGCLYSYMEDHFLFFDYCGMAGGFPWL